MSESQAIAERVSSWLKEQGRFSAPYGIICEFNKPTPTRKKHWIVVFGYARALDATIQIFNRNWIVYRDSRDGQTVFKSETDLMEKLKSL